MQMLLNSYIHYRELQEHSIQNLQICKNQIMIIPTAITVN